MEYLVQRLRGVGAVAFLILSISSVQATTMKSRGTSMSTSVAQIELAQAITQKDWTRKSVCKSGDGNMRCVCPGYSCGANQKACGCLKKLPDDSARPKGAKKLKSK